MFGLAERKSTSFKLRSNMPFYSQEEALKLLRSKLDKHSLKLSVYKKYAGKTIDPDYIKEELKTCLPKAKFSENTWSIYSNRLINFLIYSGFLVRAGRKVVVQDLGAPIIDSNNLTRRGKQRGKVFSVSVSPHVVCETIESIEQGDTNVNNISRNAISVLKRFELILIKSDRVVLNKTSIEKYGGAVEAVWSLAKNDNSLVKCVEILDMAPNIASKDLAEKYLTNTI